MDAARKELLKRNEAKALADKVTRKAKVLADKTNTTAAAKKRSAAADFDDAPSPQKRRLSGKKTEREGAPEEKNVAPKPARKAKKPVFWKASSDGEESELETVTEKDYAALEEKRERVREQKRIAALAADTEPVGEQAAANEGSTKRARGDSDEVDAAKSVVKKAAAPQHSTKRARAANDDDEDELPALKKAKATAPLEEVSGDAHTSSDASAATSAAAPAATPAAASPATSATTLDPLCKKGVARPVNGKAQTARKDKNAKDQAKRDTEAAEKAAIEAKGGKAVQVKSLFL